VTKLHKFLKATMHVTTKERKKVLREPVWEGYTSHFTYSIV
tara:strand:+ start:163 stop:285 length:123 start_codon:yes stop_codon:yes gene_type:complete